MAAKYYQKSKEILQRKSRENYQNLPKKEKQREILVIDTKGFCRK